MKIKITKIHPKAVLPQYMSSGASGCDISACIETPISLEPLDRAAVPTGIQVEIPEGFEFQVRPRSGLAIKKGLTVINTPGTIDSDYRGEVKVLLVNLGDKPVIIEPMERIAQIVLARTERFQWEELDQLSSSQRGEGGFGSTGHRGPS